MQMTKIATQQVARPQAALLNDWIIGKPALTDSLLIGLDATSAEVRPLSGAVCSASFGSALIIGPAYGNSGLGVPHGFVFLDQSPNTSPFVPSLRFPTPRYPPTLVHHDGDPSSNLTLPHQESSTAHSQSPASASASKPPN